jgi:hypothetical protein
VGEGSSKADNDAWKATPQQLKERSDAGNNNNISATMKRTSG